MTMNFNDVAILYYSIFYISKDQAIHTMKNSDLKEKSWSF